MVYIKKKTFFSFPNIFSPKVTTQLFFNFVIHLTKIKK